jgi:hypothetical protein
MKEKNTDRISIRVPSWWKTELYDRKIKIAPYVRSLIFQLIQTSDKVLAARPKNRSILHASEIYHSLNEFFVRTKSGGFDQRMRDTAFKTPIFRAEFLQKAQPEELVILGEFLGQEEFAEEVLQEMFQE